LQLFAWQAAARGNDVHLNANPTQGELLHHEYKEKKDKMKDTSKVGILAKYGGEEYLEKAPKELLQGQTEDYVEYSQTGQVVKGRERAKARSKYPEDGGCLHTTSLRISLMSTVVYINNHTAVWGSWYDPSSETWGYACCHSNIHVSYCAGQAGIEAANASRVENILASTVSTSPVSAPNQQSTPLIKDVPEHSSEGREQNFSKKRIGEGDIRLDKERLAQALNEEKKRKIRGDDEEERTGKKKKDMHFGSHDVTEEELGKLMGFVVFLEIF
jgi:pre-mRNA-processing factor SLU7